MVNLNNRELTIDELDVVSGGEGGNHSGRGDGLGWLRRLEGQIVGVVGGVLKSIGSIFGI